MAESRKMATSDRLTGLTTRCPECGQTIESDGHLYYDAAVSTWFIGFWCPTDQETFPVWKPQYQSLIDEITTGCDVDRLPDEPPA